MNTSRLIIAAAVLALSGAAVHSADKTEKYEARLTQMLEGRTAGEPVTCIALMRSNELEVLEGVGLVYDAGDTLYVSRPTDPEALGRDDILIIDRYGSQLCHTDMVHTVDRNGGYFTGVVFLGKFVPWKKLD
jgi:hypothetical protein